MSKTTFEPAWWLPGPHLQTIWPTMIRRRAKTLKLRRERIELDDGDFVDLDWVDQEIIQSNSHPNVPIVLILHGLEGSVYSPYAQGMLQAIAQAGWRGVLMHFRGCSGEMNRLPRIYHSGDTRDVAAVVDILHRRESQTPLAVIGFSIGGNVLLKWLGETGDQNPLTAAIAISVPFELDKAAAQLQKGFSRVYEWYLLRYLRRKVLKKFRNSSYSLLLANLRSLREFDDKVTAPLHGFIDAEEYYKKSSSRQFLKDIHVPTLLLQAEDDPFMTPDVIPEEKELSKMINLEVTKSGGHVGFIAGKLPWRAEYWLEQRVPLFLKEYL
jgi:predicted alpha/beta-fold hydrolase